MIRSYFARHSRSNRDDASSTSDLNERAAARSRRGWFPIPYEVILPESGYVLMVLVETPEQAAALAELRLPCRLIEGCAAERFTLPCTEQAGHKGGHRNGDIIWWHRDDHETDRLRDSDRSRS